MFTELRSCVYNFQDGSIRSQITKEPVQAGPNSFPHIRATPGGLFKTILVGRVSNRRRE